jgi:hypothetical protein
MTSFVCNNDRIVVEYKIYIIKIAPAKPVGQDDYELKITKIFGRKFKYLEIYSRNINLLLLPLTSLFICEPSSSFLSYLPTGLQCCEEGDRN